MLRVPTERSTVDINSAFEAVRSIVISATGPGIATMVQPWIFAEGLNEPMLEHFDIGVKFDDVTFFDQDNAAIDGSILGTTIVVSIVSLEPQAGDIWNAKKGDFVITIRYLDKIFRGDYNTRRRAGTFWLAS